MKLPLIGKTRNKALRNASPVPVILAEELSLGHGEGKTSAADAIRAAFPDPADQAFIMGTPAPPTLGSNGAPVPGCGGGGSAEWTEEHRQEVLARRDLPDYIAYNKAGRPYDTRTGRLTAAMNEKKEES